MAAAAEKGSHHMRKSTSSVAVATTLGAFAIAGAALAPSADARDTSHHTVWDKVSNCESNNSWHIATGNGFYGGLQFTNHTWHSFGGGKYAGRADHASRNEQIEVARRVLNAQGRNAWPVCGPHAGLTRSSGHATGSKVPNHASPPPGQKSGGHASHHAARHASSRTANHHSTHHGKHRAHSHSHSHHKTYTVRSGDTLRKIARSHHVHGGWKTLYRVNRSHMSSPNTLHVGQHLTLP
jgi:resuscitation-promoting factor RpfA